MNDTLISKIGKIQQKDNSTLNEIIEQFAPLLFKLSSKCPNDYDFKTDIVVMFIELLHNLKLPNFKNEAQLIKYIKKTMYYSVLHPQISNSKNNVTETCMSSFSEEQEYRITLLNACYDNYDNIIYEQLRSILSNKEYLVIMHLIFWGYSVKEVSQKLNVSRQNINQTKNRALSKIKISFV